MAELEIKPTAGAKLRVLFVLLSATVITGTLVFLLSGGGADSFAPKASVATYMPDSTGLAVNSEVRLAGIRIGKVTKVDITRYLDPQRAVRVDMKLVARFLKSIPQDSETSIGSDTLVGFKFIDIAQGKNPLTLSDGSLLRSEPLKKADDRADLIRTFQTELRQADELLVQISSGETKIGKFVMGDAEYRYLLQKVSTMEKAMRDFVAPGTFVGDSLFNDTLYSKVREPLLRTDASLAAIQRGEGAAGKLFASDAQYDAFVKSLRDLRRALEEANAGKGKFGPILHDEDSYVRIRKMLISTDAMLDSLQAGEGNIGELLKNPQLYESLNGSLRSMQSLLADLQANPRKYLRVKIR
jgi:phospholipid/cholesterol/gamma-HCH transport system substrate-binding protein